MLAGAKVDTLVVTGVTTSGCVRATVVDAVQPGFNVLVPRDCCADRAQPPHEASLYDMNQKYADVTDAVETGVFCINIVGHADREAVNASSAPLPAQVSEFEAQAVPAVECLSIDCPRVADAPAALEC